MGLREGKPDGFLRFGAQMTANDYPVDLASVRTNLAAESCVLQSAAFPSGEE